MKTQLKKDLHTKTGDELKKLLVEAVKTVASLKLDHQQNKLKNTRDIFNKRNEVAVLKSIMNMKKNIVEAVVETEKKVVKKVKEGGKIASS